MKFFETVSNNLSTDDIKKRLIRNIIKLYQAINWLFHYQLAQLNANNQLVPYVEFISIQVLQ